jgi:hypothetical protein
MKLHYLTGAGESLLEAFKRLQLGIVSKYKEKEGKEGKKRGRRGDFTFSDCYFHANSLAWKLEKQLFI